MRSMAPADFCQVSLECALDTHADARQFRDIL